jgi:DNA-binding FadR family transcriptional regulator
MVSGPLSAKVTAGIIDLIAAEGWPAGEELPSEAALAERFDVSVRVVRDAFRMLAAQGVVETRQGKRAVVANNGAIALESYFRYITAADAEAIDELYEVRISVESTAAGLAALRAEPEDVAAAEAALEAMRVPDITTEQWVDANLAFHGAIIEGGHNRFLSGIADALEPSLRVERTKGTVLRRNAGISSDFTIREHAEILAAVAEGDAAKASELMRVHLVSVKERFDDLVEQERAAGAVQGTAKKRQRNGA